MPYLFPEKYNKVILSSICRQYGDYLVPRVFGDRPTINNLFSFLSPEAWVGQALKLQDYHPPEFSGNHWFPVCRNLKEEKDVVNSSLIYGRGVTVAPGLVLITFAYGN